jgi:hypothetical protein
MEIPETPTLNLDFSDIGGLPAAEDILPSKSLYRQRRISPRKFRFTTEVYFGRLLWRALLVEATYEDIKSYYEEDLFTDAHPNAVSGSLDALYARFGIPVIYASRDRELAEEKAASWLSKHFTYWYLEQHGLGRVLQEGDLQEGLRGLNGRSKRIYFRFTPCNYRKPRLGGDVLFRSTHPPFSVLRLNWGQLFANGRRPFCPSFVKIYNLGLGVDERIHSSACDIPVIWKVSSTRTGWPERNVRV